MSRFHLCLALPLIISAFLLGCRGKTESSATSVKAEAAKAQWTVQRLYTPDGDAFERVTTYPDGRKGSVPATEKGESLPVPKYKFERPAVVKGIYLTAWTAGGTKRMTNLLDQIGKSEINSVVIDIRDSGQMYWKTGIPLAEKSGANRIAVLHPEVLMKKLEAKGIWPIARIACFRDQFVPKMMPERAVQRAGGGVWRDRSGHSWLDPYNRDNWEYLAKTVDFAMETGFMDIQLDYVRFPSEGKSSNQVFPARKGYPNPKAEPADVIHDFAMFIRERVKQFGRAYSADIFGIISSGGGDQGIGQTLEKVAGPFDVLSPMVYPSHYARGEYGIKHPNAQPYAIVRASLADFKEKLPEARIRPWLQDFSLGVRYGSKEVKAQIKAINDLGYQEYLLWNAGNRYTWSALTKAKKK